MIANTMRQKKSDRIYEPRDFFPGFAVKPSQTIEDQIAIVELLNEAFGGLDLRKHKETSSN